MMSLQLLRVSVHERIFAAAEDFVLQLEKGVLAAEIPALKALLTERLTAAAEEIVALLVETVAEYEDRVERSEREIQSQRRLLDALIQPRVSVHRADILQLLVSKEEVPPEQQDQEDPPKLPYIKEEQEELWTNQGREQPQGLEEVKEEEDDEEKPQCSQLHQKQTEQIVTEADGKDCGGPEPAMNSDPDRHLQPETEDKMVDSSEPETEDRATEFSVAEIEVSCQDWDDPREPQSGLNSNREPVNDERNFSCSECGETFTKSGLLETHIRMHAAERPLSCSVCGKKYMIYRYLLRHMAVHDVANLSHRCDKSECDRRLCYSHHLKKDAHTEQSLFSCSVCGRKFTQRGYLLQHMDRHTGKIRFRCCVCDKRFAWRHELKSHKCVSKEDGEAEPLDDGDNDGSGSDSDDKTSNSSEAETEIREPQSGSDPDGPVTDSSCETKSFICSDCGNMFSGEESLKNHMGTHTGEKTLSCKYCEKGFLHRDYLTNHVTVQTEEKRFLYCVCGKKFAWRYDLKNHKSVGESSQTKEDRELAACSSKPAVSFENETREPESHLISPKHHVLQGDTAERPFSCSKCRKTFRRKKNLQEHLRIHTGEKPYGCSVCMKYFSCSGSLRKHLRIHTGEKPFSCSVCGNRFTESGHLKVHMRTHTGEKPFSCSVCGKSFTWKQSFNNHMKYHTDAVREVN